MAKIRSIYKLSIECDDDCGTLIECTRDRDGDLIIEGVFSPLSIRQEKAARSVFLQCERILASPAKRSPRGRKVVRT